MATIPNLNELGTYGLRAYAGQIYDSVLLKLQGPERNAKLRAMAETDDVVGGVLKTFETLGRSVKWWMEPGDDTPEQAERAEWIWDAFNDMSHSFDEFISNGYSVLDYGFAPFEICYKLRRGPNQKDAKFRSSYNDNLYGWRKFAIRVQTSIDRWEFDENGGISKMHQVVEGDLASTTGEQSYRREIPIDKLLLIRTTSRRGSPEGRAVTENCYRSWFKKTHLEDVEAIAAELNMVGVPQQQAPEAITSFGQANSNDEVSAALRVMTTLRQGTATAIVNPHGWGPIELIKSPGPSTVNMDQLIKRLDSRMVISMLAGFLLTGMDKHGSFALSSNQFQLMLMASSAYNSIIAEPINRFAIPRLMAANKWPTNVTPKLRHGSPDFSSVKDALETIKTLGSLGSELVITPSMQRQALAKVGLEPEDKDIEEEEARLEDEKERRDEMRDALPTPPPFPGNLKSDGEDDDDKPLPPDDDDDDDE